MISSKKIQSNGQLKRFLVDFIIQSELHVRVFNYLYDPDNGSDTEDILDVTSGLYIRASDVPTSSDEVATNKFGIVNNSISFYSVPYNTSSVYIEVATNPEEFGSTISLPAVGQALVSAQQAAASAVEAQNILNNFNTKYMGATDTAPLTGMVRGSLYFDITDSELKVYNGFIWLGLSSMVRTSVTRETFTSVDGPSIFTLVTDFTENTDEVNVYINGIFQETSTFTESNNKITLDTPLGVDDTMEAVIIISAYSNSDYVSYVDEKIFTRINGIVELPNTATEGEVVFAKGYHIDSINGGGHFKFDTTMAKTNHNGGTVIDPTAIFPTDWSILAEQVTYFTTSNVGNGCWVRISSMYNIFEYGAINDGIIDNTEAFKKGALNKTMNISNGEYILSGEINFETCTVSGEGSLTKLIFTHNGNGFIFTPTEYEAISSVRNLGLYKKNNNWGSAISTTRNSNTFYYLRNRFEYENLYIGGYTYPDVGTNVGWETVESWEYGIDQGDAWNVNIANIDYVGNFRIDLDPIGQMQNAFLKMEGNGGVMTAKVYGCTAFAPYNGIEIGNKCFFMITHCDITHSYNSIIQTGTTLPMNECKISHCNLNAQKHGIYINGIVSREITGVIIRRHRKGWKLGTGNWYGIRIENCNSVWMSGIELQPDENDGAFPETQYGIYLNNCGGIMVNNYTAGATLDRAYLLSNCVQVMTNNTVTFQSNGVGDLVYRLINNSRNCSLGSYTLVSTFSGTVYSDDGTILSSNAVKLDTTSHVQTKALSIKDGITEPATVIGQGIIYIDSIDGNLKIKFADGTIKTIVTGI